MHSHVTGAGKGGKEKKGRKGYIERERMAMNAHLPINDSLKSTLSDTFAMVGTTSFSRQSRASGHCDLWAFVHFGQYCSKTGGI